VNIAGPTPPVQSALLDVKAVAQLLDCSRRHVFRLTNAGKMPPPVRVGHLVRWQRAAVESWIAAGCPAMPTRGR
jgi:excisionase family DNA binding protein